MGFLFQFGIAGFALYFIAFILCVITLERIYFLFILNGKSKPDIFLESLTDMLSEEKEKPLHIRETHISQEIDRIETILSKGFIILRFISVISPMLGLFGTILGTIEMFSSISTSDTPVTPALISGGLKEALYTTALGIAISVCALGLNVFFNSVVAAKIQKYLYILNDKNISIDYDK